MAFLEKFQQNLNLLLGQTHKVALIPRYELMGSTKQRVEELKANFGDEIKHLMEQSRAEEHEYGAMLCTSSIIQPSEFARGQGSVKVGCVVRGNPYSVQIRDCHNGVAPIGTIHSHWAVDVFSPEDIVLGIRKELLTCLVYKRNGTTYLRCLSPWLWNDYPMRTKAWVLSALNQTDQAYKKMVELAKRWGHEWEPYTQGRIRFENMNPEAQQAYSSFQYYNAIISTMQPSVEKLLDVMETQL